MGTQRPGGPSGQRVTMTRDSGKRGDPTGLALTAPAILATLSPTEATFTSTGATTK